MSDIIGRMELTSAPKQTHSYKTSDSILSAFEDALDSGRDIHNIKLSFNLEHPDGIIAANGACDIMRDRLGEIYDVYELDGAKA